MRRIPQKLVFASVVVFACLLALSGHAAAGEKNGKQSLKELQEKRLESANKAFKYRRDQFVKGFIPKGMTTSAFVGQLLQASELALKARLGAAETKEQRIKAYQNMITELEPVMDILEKTAKSGAYDADFSLSLMQAHFLAVKVGLEKEKQKK
jgi:hypothetical protein